MTTPRSTPAAARRKSVPLHHSLRLFRCLSACLVTAAAHPAAAQTLTLIHTFHHPEVSEVVFSPDGKTLATGGGDWATPDCVRLWNVATGKLRHTFRDSRDDWNIASIAFSPDGKILAYACDDKVRLWSVSTGHLLHVFSGDLVGEIEISPHNRLLVSSSGMGESGIYSDVQIWDLGSGRQRVLSHSNGVAYVTFSADGQHLWGVNSEDDTPLHPFERTWNAGTGKVERTWRLPDHILTLAVSPDRRFFATSHWDAKPQHPIPVVVWDRQTHQRISVLSEPYSEELPTIAFSHAAPWLAIGGDRLTLWNWQTGKRLFTMHTFPGTVNAVVFSPDGGILATGSEDGAVRVWRVY